MSGGAKYELAYFDYKGGMAYKDIAQKYEVSVDTVKSWKTRHWNRMDRGEGAPKSVQKKVCTQKRTQASVHTERPTVEQTLQNKSLSDKEQLFCLIYSQEFNATQAYLAVYDCSYAVANANGPRLLGKARIQEELLRLKEIKAASLLLDVNDLVELHMRMAFANMNRFAEYDADGVTLKDSEVTDGQLVSEVSEGRDGVKIKIVDRHKSLAFLERFFEANPMDRHRKEYDARKLELELLKVQAMLPDQDGDSNSPRSNFAEAMEVAVDEVWAEEDGALDPAE